MQLLERRGKLLMMSLLWKQIIKVRWGRWTRQLFWRVQKLFFSKRKCPFWKKYRREETFRPLRNRWSLQQRALKNRWSLQQREVCGTKIRDQGYFAVLFQNRRQWNDRWALTQIINNEINKEELRIKFWRDVSQFKTGKGTVLFGKTGVLKGTGLDFRRRASTVGWCPERLMVVWSQFRIRGDLFLFLATTLMDRDQEEI